MKALLYRKSIPRYLLMRFAAPRLPGLYTSPASPLSLQNVTEPSLPTPSWVRIRPRLAGICGSDLATLCAKGSPYLAPLISMPFVMGHEVVGHIVELGSNVAGFSEGDRVVLRPALACKVRGISPVCDACSAGTDALCRNVTRGDLSAGIQTGFCRDTGGGFGESLVAHCSQLYPVTDALDDAVAVLAEPLACAVHGALRSLPGSGETVLVIGCGTIGLLSIFALRALGKQVRIVAVAKHRHQREHAKRLGADEVLEARGTVAQRYTSWKNALGAEVLDPELGKPTVIGGADVTFDCIASSHSIDDGIRFTKSGGTYVLVGMPGIPTGVDWTPMWIKELNLRASYAYGRETVESASSDTFTIALKLLAQHGEALAPLVGRPFSLEDFRAAFSSALRSGSSQVVKTVFAINPT